MSRKQTIDAMAEVLKQRRDALRMATQGDYSLLRKMQSQTDGDLVDFAMSSANDEINSQLAQAESRELASVETAIDRFRNGTYGVCEACNKNIPLVRLQALPYALLCINCQRDAEQSSSGIAGGNDWQRLGEISAGEIDFSA